MMSIWSVSALIIAVLILGALIRMLIGPSASDRVVALDAINTLVVASMMLLAVIYKQVIFVDVAIVYALLSFVGTLYLARFLERDYR